MFRVVVLGGVALTAGAVSVNAVGCSGSDSSEGGPGVADSFPHEGSDTAVVDSFPREGPAPIDSGVEADAPNDGADVNDAGDARDAVDVGDTGASDTFPTEGPPPPPDSGA